MQVRDAVESDADALAALADAPVDVMRNLVHDRTVRVATDEVAMESQPADGTPDDRASLTGFVSYDARDDTVYVTQLGGEPDVCRELLGEPIRFADREGMSVEVLVAAADSQLQGAVEEAGFDREGRGPRFDGSETVRYRWSE